MIYDKKMENNYKNYIKNKELIRFLVIVLTLLQHACGINQRWCPRQCVCYNDFETADCSRRMLTHLPQFSNITKRIYGENNVIDELSYNVLGNLNNLVILNLKNNSLTQLQFKAFCGFINVMEINLARNRIKTVFCDVESFTVECRLEKMTHLHLSHNKLNSIPYNLSKVIPNLEVLNIDYNNIHSMRLHEDFTNLLSLKTLDLSGNPIHDIASEDLIPLRSISLEILKISECAIYNISRDALKSLTNLTYLSLARNLIYPQILQKAFSSLTNNNLQHLDLSEMMLTNITGAMLSQFKNLLSLDISHSSVERIHPFLFSTLSNMKIINLEGNSLSKAEGINNMQQLNKLFLRDNKLTRINLTGINSLEIVDLSGNRFSTIPQNWLSGIDTLHVLNLSNNAISVINHRAFKNVMLHTLDLSFNKLVTLHRYGLFKVQNLDMSHNRITRLTDNAFDNLEPVLEELDLSYNHFNEFPLLLERDFIALQRLSMRQNNLGEALAKGHLMALLKSLTHLQVFDLAYNKITAIPSYQVRNLHHLTTFMLEGNLITTLEDLGISELKSLAKLVVSNNLIERVDATMLENMDYLEVLDMSYNPFDCTCSILPLQSWLNTTMVMILHNDHNNYRCAKPLYLKDQNIQTVHANPAECIKTNKLTFKLKLQISGAVFATLFVLGLLSLLAFYYSRICSQIKTIQYKWQVRYREVSSAGAEYAGDILDHDLTERLTVENTYEQNLNIVK